jgi:SAM-dependent methyltransferase
LRKIERICSHIFEVSRSEGKRILDVGCGFGITSIYLAAFGALKVTGVDDKEEKISVFRKILSRLEPPLGNVEAVRQDGICLTYDDGTFDTVVARDVISHVRDPDAFLREVRRVLANGGLLYIEDGNNALDIIGRFQRRRMWKMAECGPVDGTVPYVVLGKKLITAEFPYLSAKTVDLLARKTAGLYGSQVTMAVLEYTREQRVPRKPTFAFRHPESGEYPESEFSPFELKKRLAIAGFSTAILRPYPFTGYPLLPEKGFLPNLLASAGVRVTRAFHPVSILVAPRFEILCRKRG